MRKYDEILICGKHALFDYGKFKDEDLTGLYRYDLRLGDSLHRFETIEHNVAVNRGGSVITKEEIKIIDHDGDFYTVLDEDNSPDFLGTEMTVKEFKEGA